MKTKSFLLIIILISPFIMCISPFSHAQSIEGDWYGKLKVHEIELRFNIHISLAGNGYTSKWDSPDQGVFGIASSSTEYKFPEISFSNAEAGFTFKGEVNATFTEITGTFKQGNMNTELRFERTSLSATDPADVLKQKYDKQEVYITMRDGVKLFTSIYTPKNNSVTHPLLINRTPYNIEPGGPDEFNVFMQVYKRYTDKEYIMVFQDVRGKYMSEGEFEYIRPVIPGKKNKYEIDESTDTWDTVDWLIKNVINNNGNVGIFGISYPGFYSTMGLINAHPAVKAVSPQAPVTAWFIGDDFHHNGAFFLLDCFGFFYSNGRPHRELTRKGNPGFTWPVQDNYEFFLTLGAIKNIGSKYFGDSIKFWNDAVAHPDYDEFWKARDPRQYLKNVTPAVMTVGGWFDAEDLYGALHTYEAIEKQNSQSVNNFLVMGPWSHGQWAFGKGDNLGNIYWGMDANEKFAKLEENFFDYYLKGERRSEMAEAEIFVTGSNEWRTFETWPPKNVEIKTLYFQPSGTISFSPPAAKKNYDEYVSDPMKPVPYSEAIVSYRTAEYMTDDQRFASRRPDVMVYQTEILSDDITLTGPLTADLFVSTSGTDADYVVKLIDVFPQDTKTEESADIKVTLGGYQMLIRGEVFRGKYRNSFEKPEPFVPGKVTEVKYEMPDVAHTFKKGHRIMIQVQNSWFPLVDRNPQKYVDIYKCSEGDFQKATHRIYHEKNYPSGLKVTVLK
jgi:uncharacterized protein